MSLSGDDQVRSDATEIQRPAIAQGTKPGDNPGEQRAAAKPAVEASSVQAPPAVPLIVAPNLSASTAGTAAPAKPADESTATAGPAKPEGEARNANPFLSGIDLGLAALPEGLRNLAQSGDAGAQYEVGLRFAEGRGINRDLKSAAGWFNKAASQGFAPAQYRLGSSYEKGLGVAKDLLWRWPGTAEPQRPAICEPCITWPSWRRKAPSASRTMARPRPGSRRLPRSVSGIASSTLPFSTHAGSGSSRAWASPTRGSPSRRHKATRMPQRKGRSRRASRRQGARRGQGRGRRLQAGHGDQRRQ